MKKLSTLVVALVCLLALNATAQTVLYSEDFEGPTLPSGWRTGKGPNSVGWQLGDSASLSSRYFVLQSGSKFIATNDDKHDDNTKLRNQATNDSLITAPFDFTATTRDVYITVRTRYTYTTSTNLRSWAILLGSANNGATWTALDTLKSTYAWNEYRYRVNRFAGFQSNDSIIFCLKFDDRGNWGYGWAIDDFKIVELPVADSKLEVLSYNKYHNPGMQNISLPVYITSYGSGSLSTLTLKAQLPDGSIVTRNLSSINLNPYASKFVTPTGFQVNITGPDMHYVKLWTENPNGVADADPSNDTVTIFFAGVTGQPDRKIYFEEYTGSWCQYCPDGQVRMLAVLAANNKLIPAAAHFGFGSAQNDQMETAETYEVNVYFSEGHPTASFDRFFRPGELEAGYSRGTWAASANTRINNYKVPVGLTMTHTFDEVSRDLSVTLTGTWLGADSGDFRFNVVIVEDSLSGIGAGWNQVNYYNNTASHPYYQAGNPIVGFIHRHVVRDYIGGAWGDANSGIPTKVSSGDVFSKTFTYNIPTAWDESRINVVGLIQEYSSSYLVRQVLNSSDVKLVERTTTSVNNADVLQAQSLLAPNPVKDNNSTLTLALPNSSDVSFSLTTVNGQTINSGNLGTLATGVHSFSFDTFSEKALSAGIYLLSINAGTTRLTHKVIVVD